LRLGGIAAHVLHQRRQNFIEALRLPRAPVNPGQDDLAVAFAGASLRLWWC